MTAADTSGGEDRPGDGANALTIRIGSSDVSDTEVAAITVALLASTASGAAGTMTGGPPAWRHAGMLEAATDRRVRTPAELRHPA